MTIKHNPPTLDELRSERKPITNTNRAKKDSLTPSEHFAIFITRSVGSLGFFLLLILWTVGWLLWNLYAPIDLRFDPAPAFVIWIFISNMLQLVLLPLIMVGQNIEGRTADIRAQADFEINEKAEREIETMIEHLENQTELLLDIKNKLNHGN